MTAAQELLQAVFGYRSFRGLQQPVIEHLIGGGDALVLMPTGGGKSLCYQIPALLRPGTGIVVSPLIALMQDQVDALQECGVRAAALHSNIDPAQASATERSLTQGELDLLYVAPERLLQPRTRALLERSRIALFAIDEAHCVSRWGHDFRPEYLQLSALHEHFPEVPRIALTATADASTRRDIVERLNLGAARVFVSSFDRPNIRYRIEVKRSPMQQLETFLTGKRGQTGIVYCLSRAKVDAVAERLRAAGWNALPYHAGMSGAAREANQLRFTREDDLIMVATVAFGMGIDKPDVRFVAHLDLPGSIESYYQETGRAGRDGAAAEAWMIYGLADVIQRRQMVESSEADEAFRRIERRKLDALLGLCELTSCRRQALLHYFDEPHPGACGNCDNCLAPPECWDGTVAAQMALSCVYRTGQRFGVGHLIDVLTGKADARIQRLGHDRLSTFAIGRDFDRHTWTAVFRQLVAGGLLAADPGEYGGLRLTEASRPVLRGERRVEFRKPPDARTERVKRVSARGTRTAPDDPLWQALRAKRAELARAHGVPAYVIFHDSTLAEVAALRPRSLEALGMISGIGARKLERYGADILTVVARYAAAESTSAPVGH